MTGHGNFNVVLSFFRQRGNPLVPQQVEEEKAEHVRRECQLYNQVRQPLKANNIGEALHLLWK